MTPTTIVTRSRHLEQFYYLHGVPFLSSGKDDEGMTVWEYERTPENERIYEEFKAGVARREMMKGGF